MISTSKVKVITQVSATPPQGAISVGSHTSIGLSWHGKTRSHDYFTVQFTLPLDPLDTVDWVE